MIYENSNIEQAEAHIAAFLIEYGELFNDPVKLARRLGGDLPQEGCYFTSGPSMEVSEMLEDLKAGSISKHVACSLMLDSGHVAICMLSAAAKCVDGFKDYVLLAEG